jgi:small-conductance mechanosensitive channel
MDDPWAARLRQSELHDAIWWALKEDGVTIAFPQLDVHLASDVPAAATALAPPEGPSGT